MDSDGQIILECQCYFWWYGFGTNLSDIFGGLNLQKAFSKTAPMAAFALKLCLLLTEHHLPGFQYHQFPHFYLSIPCRVFKRKCLRWLFGPIISSGYQKLLKTFCTILHCLLLWKMHNFWRVWFESSLTSMGLPVRKF